MNDIMFRAKSLATGEWLYGYFCMGYHTEKPVIQTDDGVMTHIDMKTLGQFTGCYDKRGVSIYEGDIVRKRTHSGMRNRPVYFKNGAFLCGYGGGSSTATHPYLLDDSQILVVGNIYDNPELVAK